MTYTDRSQTLTYHTCPRKWWFEYGIPTDGKVEGIRPTRLDMNLLTGSCYHSGIEALNQGFTVDIAVDTALNEFWPLVKSQGLILDSKEDASFVAYEQASLIEAGIRSYAAFVLPMNLERFKIVEVERDGVETFHTPIGDVNWGYRTDALLMEKESLDLYVLSLKTAKTHDKRDANSAQHDMQGLSEVRAVENRLKRWALAIEEAGGDEEKVPDWFVRRHIAGGSPQIMGIKMEFFLKGVRSEWPKGSGNWAFSNPLTRPWKKGTGEYSPYFEYQDELGGNHRLGKGWRRINIWEDMGVKAWIEHLAKTQSDVISGQFVLPMEYYRNEEDMDRWERQTMSNAIRRDIHQTTAAGLRAMGRPDFEAYLDDKFEMRTKSCDWPTRCEYQDICWGASSYLHDPMASGLYQIREANHKGEINSATEES